MTEKSTAAAPERRTIESWRTEKQTEEWLFRAAKAFKRWGIGSECTEAEYDSAVEQTAGLRVGGPQ